MDLVAGDEAGAGGGAKIGTGAGVETGSRATTEVPPPVVIIPPGSMVIPAPKEGQASRGAISKHPSIRSVSTTNQTNFATCPGYIFGRNEKEEACIVDDKLLHGSGSPLLATMGQVVIKLRTAERTLYGSARSVKSRYHAGDPHTSIIKAMMRMNTREAEMHHAISALRSTACNEETEEDDPLILGLETVNSSGMFRTLILSLATLRHEVSLYILHGDSALHAANKEVILNTKSLPTILGGNNDPEVEATRRINEWQGDTQRWENSQVEDFDFDTQLEGLHLADNRIISKPPPQRVPLVSLLETILIVTK